MIAQNNWFQRRKYGGWGVSPKTWQGKVYIISMILILVILQTIPVWSNETRIYILLFWMGFLFLDIIPIMINLKKDEREFKIEAIAERNSAWFMSLILVIAVLYEAINSALNNSFKINIFIIIALIGGVIVKTISNIVLERRKI